MIDLRKKYKSEFKNITPTEEQKKRVLENILIDKKPKVYLNFGVLACCLTILCLFGITNAYDIRKTFNSLIINFKEKSDEDGNKYIELTTRYDGVLELNYDAKLPEIESWTDAFERDLKINYSNYDLELILGVKFLKNSLFVEGYNINVLRKNEGKIAYGKFYQSYDIYEDDYDSFVDERKLLEHLALSAQFKTKYYQDRNEFDINIRNYYSTKNYYMDKLNTTALVVRLNERGNHYLVIFSHNNVRYSFYYDNYNMPIMEDKMLNRIHEILDSFYY